MIALSASQTTTPNYSTPSIQNTLVNPRLDGYPQRRAVAIPPGLDNDPKKWEQAEILICVGE